MSLDIHLSDIDRPKPGEPWLQLHDDALYWYLHPRIGELLQSTGQYIDDDATFDAGSLPSLKHMLAAARTDAEKQPDSWDVHVGTQTAPVVRELHRPLARTEVLDFLARWENLVAEAEARGCSIRCLGD